MIDRLSQQWSVVVLGRWNRAILTPLWIGKTLFGVNEGEKLSIRVPMDAVGPFQVAHEGVVVVAAENRLNVELEDGDFAGVERGVGIALKAMMELPRTPVAAAGINLYLGCKDGEEQECINRMWSSDLDDQLQVAGLPITDRMAMRRLAWKNGHITLRIAQSTTDAGEIQHGCWFNFEHRSEVMDDLMEWLRTPVAEFQSVADRIQAMLRARVES